MGALGGHRLTTERDDPDISQNQDDQQTGYVVGLANPTVAPMPAATFEVTKTLFLPIATGILMARQTVIIGD